jgi:hypothetical protein
LKTKRYVSRIIIQIAIRHGTPPPTSAPTKHTSDNGVGGTFNTSSPPPVLQVRPEEIPANMGGVIVRGEWKKWHKVTLMLDSPIGSERGGTLPLPNGARAPNLFADYRFQVDFYHAISGTSVSVPGHFAVNGQAATTGAVSGHVWDCCFRPMHTVLWQYTVRFKYCIDAAISTVDGPTTGSNATTATSALFVDGRSGTLTISDVINGNECSATIHLYVKGPLQVNTNSSTDSWCYQFAGTGEIHYPQL